MRSALHGLAVLALLGLAADSAHAQQQPQPRPQVTPQPTPAPTAPTEAEPADAEPEAEAEASRAQPAEALAEAQLAAPTTSKVSAVEAGVVGDAPDPESPPDNEATRPPIEPGGMTPDEVRRYFRDLRAFMKQRYDRPVTLGLMTGYGWAIDSPGVNPFGPALGANLGYTLPIYNAHVGLSGLYFIGESRRAPTTDTELPSGDYSTARATVDLGYELIFRYVRARALASGGSSLIITPVRKTFLPTFGMRAGVLVPFDSLYFGADVRLDFVLGEEAAASHAVTWLATAGLRL